MACDAHQVEGALNHTSLLFIPSTPPFDLFEPERKSHVKLYVNRVFISETTRDLIPAYLRFLRGIVDSQDLSLNVSREMLQSDPALAKIRTQVTKKVLSELKKRPRRRRRNTRPFGATLAQSSRRVWSKTRICGTAFWKSAALPRQVTIL